MQTIFDNFVAFDLETTGLDRTTDEIIEIGAVRVENGEIKDVFSTLVKPTRPIPTFITTLTGITNEDVRDARGLKDAIDDFAGFIGDSPLWAHNASFDAGFLDTAFIECGKFAPTNQIFDSYRLSKIFIPRLNGLSLGNIAKFFLVEQKRAHRASDDAATLAKIVPRLKIYAARFPEELLDKLVSITGKFDAMLSEAIYNLLEIKRGSASLPDVKFREEMLINLEGIRGEKDNAKHKFELHDVVKLFDNDGPIASILPDFKKRDVQLKMAKDVYYAFQQGEFLLIEAGTGTGKSLAYLVPAVLFALSKGERVIVSTNTKNLQEQLFFKDIPTLQQIVPFKSTLVKGRGNYICLERLKRTVEKLNQLTSREAEELAYTLVWAYETRSGDIAENINLSTGRISPLWMHINADTLGCLGHKCPFYDDCFLVKVRNEQKESQIVVVNHSLLLADVAEEFGILGGYSYLIVDEAHNLEKVAANFLGVHIGLRNFNILLGELYKEEPLPRGIIHNISSKLRKDYPEKAEKSIQLLAESSKKILTVRRQLRQFFTTLGILLQDEVNWQKKQYSVRLRMLQSDKLHRFIIERTENIKTELLLLSDKLAELVSETKYFEDDILSEEYPELVSAAGKLKDTIVDFLFFRKCSEPEYVFWVETGRSFEDVTLHAAPTNVGELLDKMLYKELETAVFTSATLTVERRFAYIKERLGINRISPDRVSEELLGSPYNFKENLLVLLPVYKRDDEETDDWMAQVALDVSRHFRRGSLFLFTAYNSLSRVHSTLEKELPKEGIAILAQGVSGSRYAISSRFKESRESILLGTNSFWEGADFKGETLEVLYISKLPFAVPTEPYHQAICEKLENEGKNSFLAYILPECILKFRQGLGRLIRHENDVGVAILFDRRVIDKRYSPAILNSLPTMVIPIYSQKELIIRMEGQFR